MDVVSEVLQESGSDVQPATSPFSKLHRIAIAASERYTLNNLLPPSFLWHINVRRYIFIS